MLHLHVRIAPFLYVIQPLSLGSSSARLFVLSITLNVTDLINYRPAFDTHKMFNSRHSLESQLLSRSFSWPLYWLSSNSESNECSTVFCSTSSRRLSATRSLSLHVSQAGASTPYKRWSKCTMEKV